MTKPPSGLLAPGRALWRAVHDAYELEPAEPALLLAACRTVDELDRLTTELATAPLTVVGSTGQPRANPLLAEVRQHRQILAVLLAQLEVPVDEVVPVRRRQRGVR